jgi:heavy metal sensor kinase
VKTPSIGLRLTLWYLAIFAMAQVVFGAGMWFVLRHHLYDLADDNIENQIEDLTKFLAAQPKDISIPKLQEEVAETYVMEHSGDYLQVSTENGVRIYQSAFLQRHALPYSVPGVPGKASFENRRLGHRPFRFTSQKIAVNGRLYTIQMGEPTDDVMETLSVFRFYLLTFAPLLLLLLAGGGYWLSRRALSPVDALVRTARTISGTNLHGRLEKLHTGDELQRLSDTLNEMLDRIEAAFRSVTQFTADASHELRTPVSLMRTEAELALRKSRGETEYKESLRHILVEAERTTLLIEELLSLARADSGGETLKLQAIDLKKTLRGAIDGWRQVATIRNIQFAADIEAGDAFVLGDQAALRRVIDILLDNAFKYTRPGGTVSLSLEQRGTTAVIRVRDDGIGIAEQEHDKVFERFYRVDKARSRELGGSGLGLSIAQWIVLQHRGFITLESNLGEGSVFCVELPLTHAPVQNPLLA